MSPCHSDVVAAHKSWCFGIILPSLCWTHQPFTPENLLQLDFFHQHFHLCAHVARLKQIEFICFKPGFGKFLCLVWNVSCYDLNRLCLVFTSSKYLRLNPGSEVFTSQLPARTTQFWASVSASPSPPHPVQVPHSKHERCFLVIHFMLWKHQSLQRCILARFQNFYS